MKAAEESVERVKIKDEVSDVQCELCGKQMVYKYGRFGRFLACPGFPECKNVKSIQKEIGVDCPFCGDKSGGKVVERRSKKGRKFFGCSEYPECNFISWYPPAKIRCPECGSYCVIKRSKNREMVACSQKECSYQIPLQEAEARVGVKEKS